MTEQEQFEASIATRIHPVNFTKVNDLPILGWNGAKPNDYVDPKIQQHWITWQAAQQEEGYVLVPVEQAKDIQRVDWLADVNNKIGNVQLPTACVEKNPHSLRAAIDAAMIEAAQEAE